MSCRKRHTFIYQTQEVDRHGGLIFRQRLVVGKLQLEEDDSKPACGVVVT